MQPLGEVDRRICPTPGGKAKRNATGLLRGVLVSSRYARRETQGTAIESNRHLVAVSPFADLEVTGGGIWTQGSIFSTLDPCSKNTSVSIQVSCIIEAF